MRHLRLIVFLGLTSCLVFVEAPPECFVNADCPSSETCGAGNECTFSCSGNSDCLVGEFCVDYDCSPTPECVRDSDCEYDWYECIQGSCE